MFSVTHYLVFFTLAQWKESLSAAARQVNQEQIFCFLFQN